MSAHDHLFRGASWADRVEDDDDDDDVFPSLGGTFGGLSIGGESSNTGRKIGGLGLRGNKKLGGIPGLVKKDDVPATKDDTSEGKAKLGGIKGLGARQGTIPFTRVQSEQPSDIAGILDKVQKENITAMKKILDFIESLSDRTLSGFQDLNRQMQADKIAHDSAESINMLLANIDNSIANNKEHAYIIIPGEDTAVVNSEELVKKLNSKTLHIVGDLVTLSKVVNDF